MSHNDSPPCQCGCGLFVAECLANYDAILEFACEQWQVDRLKPKTRTGPDHEARTLAMALIRGCVIPTPTLEQIGSYMKCHHGTVLYACRRIERMSPANRTRKIYEAGMRKFSPKPVDAGPPEV